MDSHLINLEAGTFFETVFFSIPDCLTFDTIDHSTDTTTWVVPAIDDLLSRVICLN